MDWNLESITDGYLRMDRRWVLEYVNGAAEELLGIRRVEVVGKEFWEVFPDAVGSVFDDRYRAAMRTQRTVRFQTRVTHRNRILFVSAYPSHQGLQVLCRDVTDEANRQAEIRQSRQYLREMVENLPAGAVLVDNDGGMLVNRKAEWILGYSRTELTSLEDFFSKVGGWRAKGMERIYSRAKKLGFPEAVTVKLTSPSGSIRHVEIAAHAGDGGEVWILHDVTSRVEAERELRGAHARVAALAETDGLTGLLNRRALDERLVTEIRQCRLAGNPMSFLLADLDRFKGYNDSFGHIAGDAVLQTTARLLRANVRPNDFVSRYGGEEFAIALPGAGIEEGLLVAERICEAFRREPWPHRMVTVSIGLASRGSAQLSAKELLTEADEALYRAKAAGRDRVARAVITSV